MDKPSNKSRRRFLKDLGFYAFLSAVVAQFAAFIRFLMPDALKKPPHRIKIGAPQQFPQGATFIRSASLFVVRRQNEFYAISAICTHLGCTVNKERGHEKEKSLDENFEFDCPCHGSQYDDEGRNISGPAPRPLQRFKLHLADDDGQLLVDLQENVDAAFRLCI